MSDCITCVVMLAEHIGYCDTNAKGINSVKIFKQTLLSPDWLEPLTLYGFRSEAHNPVHIYIVYITVTFSKFDMMH